MTASAEQRALMRRVEFLAPLDDATLNELFDHGRLVQHGAGSRIVSALEFGAEVYVLLAGRAEVVVEPRGGASRVLHTLVPGSAFGEMASLTGELRSATVIAVGDAEVLAISDAAFDALRARRPEVAVALLPMLGRRLLATDRSIDALLTEPDAGPVIASGDAPLPERGSIRRVWRELVVGRHKDLPFLTLAAFVITLLAVRLAVYLAFRLDVAPRGVLRAAYLSGFALVFGSTATALLTFRPGVRRLIAIAYGIGAALIANELGVTLAFDIFYKDIHTPDPDVPFDIERLYRRAEPIRAIAIGLVVLIQAAYLRRFYRRAWFIVRTTVIRTKAPSQARARRR